MRVHVRAGLRVLFDGVLPLGGAPTRTVTASVVAIQRAVSARGIGSYFDARGAGTIAGRAALLARGGLSDQAVDEAATAGARSILVDGPLPAGAYGLAVPTGVPVVGLPSELSRAVRALDAAGIPVTVSVGAVHVSENVDGGSVAAFSSRGLAFGGGAKPEIVAPGVSVPTSEPGRSDEAEVRYGTISGTSVSAAVAAGAAAVLAQARPRASALGLRGLLVGSARVVEDGSASTAGRLDLHAAVQQEVVAEPDVLSLVVSTGRAAERRWTIRVRNLSTRRVPLRIRASSTPAGLELTARRERLLLRPNEAGDVLLDLEIKDFEPGRVATGELELVVRGSPVVRVPWIVSRPPTVDLLSQVSLEKTGDRITDATPAVVSFVAGTIAEGTDPAIRPVGELEVQLWRGRKLRGVLSLRRELLPGRYTFGLTGRGPRGERLRRGAYIVRLVARPEDGTRQQVESVSYLVR
ncbi:MAG: S8 family serine peptidase [Actinobacteria bacterium]|nr:S8 family serine peptidase [Actinomycetota bacterium]